MDEQNVENAILNTHSICSFFLSIRMRLKAICMLLIDVKKITNLQFFFCVFYLYVSHTSY